jgi:Flp pilus assembly protein TadG
MVEFALVLPLLVMLIFGMIEFGDAYNKQIALQAAAREGARELALGHDDEVAGTIDAAAPSVDAITIVDTVGCEAGSDDAARVEISAPIEIGILFLNTTQTLHATGVMRCGL